MNKRKNRQAIIVTKAQQSDDSSAFMMWMLGLLPLLALFFISYKIIISTL